MQSQRMDDGAYFESEQRPPYETTPSMISGHGEEQPYRNQHRWAVTAYGAIVIPQDDIQWLEGEECMGFRVLPQAGRWAIARVSFTSTLCGR